VEGADTQWQTMMKEDSGKGSDARPSGEMNDSRTPLSDASAPAGKTSKSELSNYRMLLEFFSKEDFVEELRTLNTRLGELQRWHDEWEQKQKALEDEREKYRLLEGAISEVILLLDASLRVLYCTSSIESLTGHKKEEIISRRLEKLLMPPSFKAFMEELADELVANSSDAHVSSHKTTELELYSKKGGSIAGSARIGVRRGNDREPAEIIIIISSIRDKKRSEKLLWEAREQYRILFQEMKEPAYFVTADGVFLDVNPAWLERFGYSRDEIIGVDIREVFSFPSKHPLYHHRAEGKETRELQARLRQRSGAEQEYIVTATAWRGQNRELLGYVGVIRRPGEDPRDIRPEGTKEDFRDILLAAVAHEIKKPISVVAQGLEQVSKAVHDPIAREALEKVSQAAMRANKVMNSVLDLYRGSPPTYEQTDVEAVNNEILFSYDEEIRARNISVITDFAPGLPSVKADAGRLGQVITNIIANAMAAMPRSGVITVKATKQTGEDGRNHVSLIYADTGSGMSENELRRVFDPFFTTKGHSGGIGLGLTLSREIIERCGGSIKIESRAGEGTTVSLLLPCN
jgi:PAS domain S-box-containing protein